MATTIKILNRNSNATYDCNVPFIYKKNANETLGSGNVRITHLTSKIDIEPFDDVELNDGYSGKKYYLCVDTFTCTQEGLDNPTYTYDISLFSRTKKLEGRLCPNLSITSNDLNRSVWFYLNEYNNQYGEKIRVKHANDTVTFELKYPFAPRVQTKFSAITCPEMQWNTPTLREVLNDLMMAADCIPVIRNKQIDYMDLTEINVMDNAKKAHINYITESQSSEDYVSELQMDMQNSMQREYGLANEVRTEIVHFDSDDSILTTDNVFLKTAFPIYDIEKVTLQVPVVKLDDQDNTKAYNYIETIDITNYIHEYQKFITLPVVKQWIDATLGDYQNSSLYYHRGGNRIENFGYLTPLWKLIWSGPDKTVIQKLYDIEDCNSEFFIMGYTSPDDIQGFNPSKCWATVTYIPQNNVLFRASKNDYPRNKRIVIDNQTNSYVNAYKQGMLEYFKANRLGNLQYQYNAVYRDEVITPAEIIDIFDSYEGNVVYEVQYQMYNDHMEVNALATKNYVLRDYFTGIKAKLRSWRIVDGSEAFTRNELRKLYFEFDMFEHQDIDMGVYADFVEFVTDGYNHITQIGSLSDSYKIKYIVASNAHTPGYMLLEMSEKAVGKSITYSFGFDDNFYAGKGVQGYDSSVSGAIFDYYTYTDNRGECTYLLYSLCNGTDPTNDGDYNILPYSVSKTQRNLFIDKMMFDVLSTRPEIPYNSWKSYEVLDDNVSFLKDNKEIIKINLQFEFSNISKRIYMSDEFAKDSPLIRSEYEEYYIYKGPRDNFDYRNPSLTGAEVIGALNFNTGAQFIVTAVSNSTMLFEFDTTESVDNAFYLVKGLGGQIIFGIDGRKTCYLNLLKDRNKDIYDESGNIIDSI